MAYKIGIVEVWAGDILNRPGMLARVLESLSNAGAQLEFLIARKASPSTSRVFLAPIKTKKQKQAADDVGLARAKNLFSLRIEGPDKAGLGARLTRAVAARGINLRGASAAAMGRKTVFYLAFDRQADLKPAAAAIRKALA